MGYQSAFNTLTGTAVGAAMAIKSSYEKAKDKALKSLKQAKTKTADTKASKTALKARNANRTYNRDAKGKFIKGGSNNGEKE